MADNNIVYKIRVDSESGTASIRDLKGQIVATQVPVNKLKEKFNDLTVSINNNKNATDGNVVAHKNSEFALNAEISKLNSLRSALDISSKEYQEMGNTIDLLNQKKASLKRGTEGLVSANGMLKNSSGAAASAAMELGRVISDAPYGIRGMANNITQLVSQLGFATTSAGSFSAAMRQMWTALMGPLGIVLAITSVVSVLDMFLGANKKAEKSSEDLTKKIEKQIEVLTDYETALTTANLSLEERNGLIKAAAISSPAFLKAIKDASGALTDQEDALIKLIEKQEKDLEVKKKVSELEKINKGIREQEIKGIDNIRIAIDKQKEARRNAFSAESKRGFTARITALEKIEGYYIKQKELLAEINELIEPPEDKKPLEGSVDWYEAEISRLEEFRDKSTKAGSKAYEGLNQEIIKQQERLKKLVERDEAKIALTNFETADEIREKTKKHANNLLKAIEETYEDSDVVKWAKGKLSIPVEFDLKPIKADTSKDELTQKLEAFVEFAEDFQKVLTHVNDFAQAQFDRELVIEQNKTTALNEQLNQRLLNENLSAEERKKIQNEIAKNDEALRKKQNEINKKKFNAQKAFNISMAVIDTAKAAAGVMAEAPGGFLARLAQAIPTIAFGLAQVATISRQKFQAQSATTPIRTSTAGGGTGGGDGVGDRSFNFNLVGNTLGNQITDAIQGQFDQPLKAYVVSRDITSQQALDANIKGTASF